MQIENIYFKDSCQQIMHITYEAQTQPAKVAEVLDGLDHFLAKTRDDISGDERVYYYGYTVRNLAPSPTFLRRITGKARQPESEREIDPWAEQTIQFWKDAARETALHQRIKKWLDDAADLIAYADTLRHHTASLWEYDTTQLGEAEATTLALIDVTFVPKYTALLRVWDLEHEVTQYDTINAIFGKYGICPETEDLLVCRMAENSGQHEDDNLAHWLPTLEEHYGPFTKSRLFQRIVAQCHVNAVDRYNRDVIAATQRYKERLIKNPKATMPQIPAPTMAYLGQDPLIAKEAERIFQELETARLA